MYGCNGRTRCKNYNNAVQGKEQENYLKMHKRICYGKNLHSKSIERTFGNIYKKYFVKQKLNSYS